MIQTAYKQYVDNSFEAVTTRVIDTLNGRAGNGSVVNPNPYFFNRMLTKQFSLSGRWEALNYSNTTVIADYVSMDSQLPLKKRDSFGKAYGEIPKQAQKYRLNETQLTEIDTLINMGADNAQIAGRLYQDVPRAIRGVYDRNEATFLEALSTGVALIDDVENVGLGIRADFGYLAENKFGVGTLWTNPASKPFDDLARIKKAARAKGNNITRFLIDPTTLDRILATEQAKQLYAFRMGFVGASIPTPDADQVNAMTQARYGYTFEVVDVTFNRERDGVRTNFTPWQAGMVVGVTSPIVGTLQWANLAEMNHRNAGVNYQTLDNYILVSQYRELEPLAECVSSQARVLPVISNVDQIYQLDSTTVQA